MTAHKAIAGFIVSYVMVLVSPLGIDAFTTFEEALTTFVSALLVSGFTAISVYMTRNKVK